MQTTYESPHSVETISPSIKDLPRLATIPYNRLVMTVWLMLADAISLAMAGVLAAQARMLLGAELNIQRYYDLAPMLILFIVGYLLVKMYPGVGINQVQEIKCMTHTSSVLMVVLTALIFMTQTGLKYSRLVFLLFWIFILLINPLMRMAARRIGVIYHFWGEPVALIGFGPQGKHIYRYLKKYPTYGIKPVVVVKGVDGEDNEGEKAEILEIATTHLERDHTLLKRAGIRTAILAPTEIPENLRKQLVDEQEFGLERIILVSSLNWVGEAAVVPHDLGGILGLEVERNLLHRREQVMKKILDISLMTFVGMVGFPLIIICAILIKLDSEGPIFYKQYRVGKEGKGFWVWKFRTMVINADEILEKYLEENPELKTEWEETHKLKNDPRITRIGGLLRKTSLDELPQLINVLRGEMSLVGPRPIVKDEIKFYKEGFRLYSQVQPGVTGLWQISGRSDTSYERRVMLDKYYIRHWSIWLDIYILLQTVWVVVKLAGAY
jgi:Undecaprenyl-phosphate galactose phosphotransferase WbaP